MGEMDLSVVALFATAVAFSACLVAIAACDLSSYTIPNSIGIALVWLFFVAVPLAPGAVPILSHVYSLLTVFAIGLLAYRFGIFGGGDVKSWAAIALWYDFQDVPLQLLGVALIGSGLGLAILGARRVAHCHVVHARFPQGRVPRLLRAGEPVPYGVAIALGTALTAGHIDLFQSLSF